MAEARTVKITIIGDSTRTTKSLNDVGDAAGRASVSVEGFGRVFTKMGMSAGVASAIATRGIDLLTNVFSAAARGAMDYRMAVESGTIALNDMTGSQAKTAELLALARAEADKGRGSFADLVQVIQALTPASQQSGVSMESLIQLAERLSILNPAEGLTGASRAISEALAGDFVSLQERFNIPRSLINQLKREGKQSIELVSAVLDQMGVSMAGVDAKARSTQGSLQRLQGTLNQLAGEGGAPLFDALTNGINDVNEAMKQDSFRAWFAGFTQGISDVLAAIGTMIDGIFSLDPTKILMPIGLAALGLGNTVGKSLLIVAEKTMGTLTYMVNGFLGGIEGLMQHVARIVGGPFAQQLADGLKLPRQELIGGDTLRAWGAEIQASADTLEQAWQQYVNPRVQKAISDTPGDGKGGGGGSQTARRAGSAILRGFIEGFQQGGAELFGQLQSTLSQAIKAANPDLKDDQIQDQVSQLAPLLAQAADEVTRLGQVSAPTWAALQQGLGANTTAITRVIVAYQEMSFAQQMATKSADDLTEAQTALKQVQDDAAADLKPYTDALDAATQAQQDHAAAAEAAIDPLGRQSAAMARAAEDAARGYADRIDGLNETLRQMQQDAEAASAGFDSRLNDVRARQTAEPEQARLRQEGFRAAVAGTTEEFLRQNDQIDERTRKIVESWNAELEGKRRASQGTSERVTRLEREQREKLLAYDERIASAKTAQERAAIQRERDRYKKDSDPAIALERSRAAVAADRFAAAQEAAEKELGAITEQDAAQAKATEREIAGIEAEKKAKEEADRTRIAAQQEAIRLVQDEAKQRARADADALRALNDRIAQKRQDASDTAKEDQAAIDRAKAAYNDRKAFWDGQETSAKSLVDHLTTIKTQWDGAAASSKETLDNITQILALLAQNGITPGQGGGMGAGAAAAGAAATAPPMPIYGPPDPGAATPSDPGAFLPGGGVPVPAYAQGGVVSRPHLAVVGDTPGGIPEVISPVPTMQRVVSAEVEATMRRLGLGDVAGVGARGQIVVVVAPNLREVRSDADVTMMGDAVADALGEVLGAGWETVRRGGVRPRR